MMPRSVDGLSGHYPSSKRAVAYALLLLLVLTCGALVLSAMSLSQRIEAVRSADSDNQGWLVAQLDVDYKAMRIAAREYIINSLQNPAVEDQSLADLRLKFDIFYSRVDTVVAAMSYQDVSERISTALDELLLIRRELAEKVDSLEPSDVGALEDLSALIDANADLVRNVTTMSLQYHVGKTKEARNLEKAHLQSFWYQSIVLLLVLLGASILALRLWQDLEEQTAIIRRASDMFSKAIKATLSAVVVTDLDGKIRLVNNSACEIFGLPENEMVGRNISEIMVPEHLRAAHEKGMQEFRLTGRRKIVGGGTVRLDAQRADGTLFPSELSITQDVDLNGEPVLIGFIRDISDVVAAENELRKARDEAQSHAEAKTMFLATMSHEMRTPLHGVIASLELIEESQLPAENRHFLQTAKDCSDRALQQINDVLDITRLGKTASETTTFSPVEIAETIVGELSALAHEHRNSLVLKATGEGVDGVISGSPTAFSRALYNLVGNAVKFTRNGRVVVCLSALNINDERVLRVQVSDTGPGIAPDDQQRIFKEFETGTPGQLHGPQGTGLGLSIARVAVERLGGQLSLVSALGEGSEFSFEFPLRTARHPAGGDDDAAKVDPGAEPLQADPYVPLKVLIVDDSPVNVRLMAETVRRLGHDVATASDGAEAIEKAHGTRFDAILMDISMPVVNGMEAATRIRMDGLSRDAFIAAVTAVGEPERKASFLAAGMNAVVVKPAKRNELRQLLLEASGHKGTTTGADGSDPISDDDLEAAFDQLVPHFGINGALNLLEQALAEIPDAFLAGGDLGVVDTGLVDQLHKAAGATAVAGLTVLSEKLLLAEKAAEKSDTPALEGLRAPIAALVQGYRAEISVKASDATGRVEES